MQEPPSERLFLAARELGIPALPLGRRSRSGKGKRHDRPQYVNCVRIVQWMRNASAHAGKAKYSMASAALRQAFLRPDQDGAKQTWCHVADQLRERWPKLGKLMHDSEHDVLAYMAFPVSHRTKLHSTNPLERLNKEVKRRAGVVGIFPAETSIIRLIGAVLLEANDEWQMQHRYMGVEAMSEMLNPTTTNEILQLPPNPA